MDGILRSRRNKVVPFRTLEIQDLPIDARGRRCLYGTESRKALLSNRGFRTMMMVLRNENGRLGQWWGLVL